jgi:hypothetical protein
MLDWLRNISLESIYDMLSKISFSNIVEGLIVAIIGGTIVTAWRYGKPRVGRLIQLNAKKRKTRNFIELCKRIRSDE